MSGRPRIRCAIYTRKSSEDGLDQEFNSLDAQHEACAAYVASQRHEGWKMLPARYDDGGISGGTLDRPALQRLLDDIDAGRVDMVVVYKIDRLTRSLPDFVRMVDRLDAAGCTFVSVTQAFNTSSSMGRLTLNMLLSFAQFERELTSERIRDKIAASKKKGLWMGGVPPIGYDPHPDPMIRELVVNQTEAATVQQLFTLYDQLGCLSGVARAAEQLDLRSKQHVFASGREQGGHAFKRGQIYTLLRNPVYLGRIRHKEKVWPGQHQAIIDEALWDRVQEKLQAASARPRTTAAPNRRNGPSGNRAWLTGKLRDSTGDRLTPTHTTRMDQRLRYYISNRLISGGTDPSGWRLPGPALETAVLDIIAAHLETAARTHRILNVPDATISNAVTDAVCRLVTRLHDPGGQVGTALIGSGTLHRDRIDLALDQNVLTRHLGIRTDALNPELLQISAPFTLRRRGVEMKIIAGEARPQPDPHLRAMLIRAHGWARDLRSGVQLTDIARRERVPGSFIRTRAQLAFLSPKIQTAILNGTQPTDLTLKRLVSTTQPLDWAEQEQMLGF